jgi:hypothetical protein
MAEVAAEAGDGLEEGAGEKVVREGGWEAEVPE